VAALLIGLGQAAVRISLKGQANSAAAAAYGLNQAFAVKDAQAVYLALGDEELAPALATKAAAAPFLAVQAAYASPLTAQADVVLPVEMWAEQDGHFVNLEGRLQTAHRALTPPEGVLSNVAVLQRLGQKLGLALNNDWQTAL
jgi:NADH dehydrogenase/NADH:ubiquinone oxidoreductase subunit G